MSRHIPVIPASPSAQRLPPDVCASIAAKTAMNRTGSVEEVADVVHLPALERGVARHRLGSWRLAGSHPPRLADSVVDGQFEWCANR
jgi:hypothetical protein